METKDNKLNREVLEKIEEYINKNEKKHLERE